MSRPSEILHDDPALGLRSAILCSTQRAKSVRRQILAEILYCCWHDSLRTDFARSACESGSAGLPHPARDCAPTTARGVGSPTPFVGSGKVANPPDPGQIRETGPPLQNWPNLHVAFRVQIPANFGAFAFQTGHFRTRQSDTDPDRAFPARPGADLLAAERGLLRLRAHP